MRGQLAQFHGLDDSLMIPLEGKLLIHPEVKESFLQLQLAAKEENIALTGHKCLSLLFSPVANLEQKGQGGSSLVRQEGPCSGWPLSFRAGASKDDFVLDGLARVFSPPLGK